MKPDHRPKSILVLCEGNHCRSPIAEALLKTALTPEVRVESAGLRALVGEPADVEAQVLMRQHGLDLAAHRGRQWGEEMALGSDLILVMDEQQKSICEREFPSARGRVFLLGHWLDSPDREVPDPFRRGSDAFRCTYEHILRAVESWLPRLTH